MQLSWQRLRRSIRFSVAKHADGDPLFVHIICLGA
jgi:hypothetical protein